MNETSLPGQIKAAVLSIQGHAITRMLLRGVVTAVLLAWVAFRVDFQSVGQLLRHARGDLLLLGFGVYLLGMIAATWRWQILLRGLGIAQSLLPLTRIFFVSFFFSMFLPSSIGGDVARMVLLNPDGSKREDIVSSVLVDRLIGLAVIIAGGLCAALTLPIARENTDVMLTLLLMSGAFLAGLALLFNRFLLRHLGRFLPQRVQERFQQPVVRVYNSIVSFRRSPQSIFGAVVASVLLQVATCLSVYFAGLAFGVQVSVLVYFALIPIGLAITTLPISINGLGVQDQAMLLLFAAVSVPADQALTLSLYMHLLRNAVGIMGGVWFLLSKGRE